MKKILASVIVMAVLFSGCEYNIAVKSDQYRDETEYEGNFTQDWFTTTKDATLYQGNVYGYYVDEQAYVKQYNIYNEDIKSWFTIQGAEIPEDIVNNNELMVIPAYIYIKEVNGAYEVVALSAFFDDMTVLDESDTSGK